jgi:hypothetical protein
MGLIVEQVAEAYELSVEMVIEIKNKKRVIIHLDYNIPI